MKYSQWNIKEVDQDSLSLVQEKFNIPPTIARIMILRKIIDREESRSFFYPDITNLIDPLNLRDMDKAIDRLIMAINNQEHIMIMGDYDVDGISSVSVFMLFCKDMEISSSFYIPNRSSEGYGLSKKAIDHAKELGAKLIVTSDCGITAIDEIPILSVLATQAKGAMIIDDAQELRIKETDRIKAILYNLKNMKADIQETDRGMIIRGDKILYSTTINDFGDHRIAMSFYILNLLLNHETINKNLEIANISFPEFHQTLKEIVV